MNTQTLKGFRDFLPEDAIKRQFMIDTIKRVFERFGFDPLETPALEYAEVLSGKYGEDADKLLYIFEDRGGRKVGLRYDQTVPTARVVAQYQDLVKPFKRYQIQLVWRAENTQKGRYREFLQCDADIIGDSSPTTADAEILTLFAQVYKALGFNDSKVVVNSRVILRKLINESLGENPSEEQFLSVVRSIDKLDKIGQEGVAEELKTKGISQEAITALFSKVQTWNAYTYKEIQQLDEQLASSLTMAIEHFNIPQETIVFNATLARGLDYYTGLIFEAAVEGYPGSLGGGGRYDKLIGSFTGKDDVTAVGFAIGFDRTLEVADSLGLLPKQATKTKVLVAYKDDGANVFSTALNLVATLRENNINAELFLNPQADLEKQIKYADKKGISYVAVIGPDEAANNVVTLKNMASREQKQLTSEDLIKELQ